MSGARHRVIVVGGGIAGLATVHRLLHPGPERGGAPRSPDAPDPEVVLVERDDRLGGKIRTDHEDGFLVEAGPDSFLSSKPGAIQLVHELGIAEELLPTVPYRNRAFIRRNGTLYPLPEGLSGLVPVRLAPLFRSSLLSKRACARVACERWVPRRRSADDESIAHFVRRRFGRETYTRLMQPLLSGIYGGEAEHLSVEATFPRLVRAEREAGSVLRGLARPHAPGSPGNRQSPFVSLRNGMEDLVHALARHIDGVRRVLGAAVNEVRWTRDAVSITTDAGSTIEANAVILAVPADEAAAILTRTAPALSTVLGSIPMSSTIVVSMGFRRDAIAHSLEGHGYLNPRAEGRRVLACTWCSSKFAGRTPSEDTVLIRCFLKPKHDELKAQPCATGFAEAAALEEVAQTLEARGPPLWTRVHSWPRAQPQYTLGHLGRLNQIEQLLAELPGIFLTGSSYRGVGIPDTIRAAQACALDALQFLATTAPRPQRTELPTDPPEPMRT